MSFISCTHIYIPTSSKVCFCYPYCVTQLHNLPSANTFELLHLCISSSYFFLDPNLGSRTGINNSKLNTAMPTQQTNVARTAAS